MKVYIHNKDPNKKKVSATDKQLRSLRVVHQIVRTEREKKKVKEAVVIFQFKFFSFFFADDVQPLK
jgi:hypothetical protein